MDDIRVIIESSSLEGLEIMLQSIGHHFYHISATMPVKTPDGRFISSVHLSNKGPVLRIENVDRM